MFRGGFLHFLHQWKQEKLFYRGMTKFATLPQLCLYTTWENLKTYTTAHFETNRQCILMLNAINSKNESKWTVFRACAQKCPPSSRAQPAKRSLHWSTALSMICCSSLFQTVSRRCRSSSVFWMWRNYDVITDEEPLNINVQYLFFFSVGTQCWNPSRNVKVIVQNKVARFLWPTVYNPLTPTVAISVQL